MLLGVSRTFHSVLCLRRVTESAFVGLPAHHMLWLHFAMTLAFVSDLYVRTVLA